MVMAISESLEGVYAAVLRALRAAKVPFVVGGAWALERYTLIGRNSPDLDLMVEPAWVDQAVDAITSLGGQRFEEGTMIDRLQVPLGMVNLVHHLAQGEYPVTAEWVTHGVPARLYGAATLVASPEYLIWAKAFVASRHRFDGADVMHLLSATIDRIDWKILHRLFAPYPELLAAYVNLFAFVYPDLRDNVPAWLTDELWREFETPVEPSAPKITRGPLIDSHSFEFDIVAKGFLDSRQMD